MSKNCFSDARGGELEFIGTQMMEKHIETYKLNISLEQNPIYVNFEVKEIFRKKLLNKHKKLNKKLFTVNEALAQNPHQSKRTIRLDTFFVWDLNESYRLNINDLDGLSGQIEFPTADKQEIVVNLTGSERGFARSINRLVRKISDPIKIKMDPMTKNHINLNYYTFDTVWTYRTDFEINNTSTINIENSPCPAEASPSSPKVSINVVDFLDHNRNFIDSINYENNHKIKLEHLSGKYILRGFMTIEKLSSGEITTVVSDKGDL